MGIKLGRRRVHSRIYKPWACKFSHYFIVLSSFGRDRQTSMTEVPVLQLALLSPTFLKTTPHCL
jgi:hypothetical protein